MPTLILGAETLSEWLKLGDKGKEGGWHQVNEQCVLRSM